MNKNCSKAIILLSGIMLLSGCKEAANTYIDEVPQTVTSISEGSSVTEVPDKVEASSDSHKSEVYDAIFNHEIKNAKASSYVVIGGYEFKINSSSYCKYFDDVGPVIIVGEQLQYRIKVQDKSYEETRDGDITAKAVNAGAIITEGPSVINSNGFEYQYFVYELQGDNCIAVNLPGPDEDHAIGIQIAVLDNAVTADDAINAALSVVRTATKTTSPDSTAEEINNQYNLTGDSENYDDTEDVTLGPVTSIKHDQTYKGTVDNYLEAVSLIKQYGNMQRATYDNPAINEIELRLQNKYDIAAVNLGEMDIDTATEIEQAVEYMFETYPVIRGSLNTISLANMKGRANSYIALTQTVDFILEDDMTSYPRVNRNEIILNANKWLNRDGMLEMCQNQVNKGYWFKNATNPSKIIVHELGHQLLDVLRAREYGFYEEVDGKPVYLPCLITEDSFEAYLDYYWSGTAANQTYEKELMENSYKDWLSAGHKGSEEDFRTSISKYANGIQNDGGISYQETFAEAVADVYVNGDNASDASKIIVAHIK